MNIFTYGTLMAPKIWSLAVKRNYRVEKGILYGFERKKIAGEVYPGIRVAADSHVEGIVYYDVSESDVQLLDVFEGHEYERIFVDIQTISGTKTECGVYFYKAELLRKLTDEDWDYEDFLAHGVNRFIASFSGWNEITMQ